MIDMSAENIQNEFSQNGFVIVEGLLDVNLDLQPLVADYASLLDQLAVRWHAEGKRRLPMGSCPSTAARVL